MIATGQPIYTFEYALDEDAYAEYSLYSSYSKPEIRRQATAQKYLSVLFYVAIGVYGNFVVRDWLLTVTFLLLAVYVMITYRMSIRKNIRRSIQRMKNTGKLPFESNEAMHFTDRELVCVAEENTSITKYTAIERIVVGKNALYLYKNAISAYILPKKAIRGVTPEAFLQWILEKTNASLVAGRTR